jgi:hypothetical protein
MPDDSYTCQSCRLPKVRASFVERFHSASSLWTVPTRCVDCGGPEPQPEPAADHFKSCHRCGQTVITRADVPTCQTCARLEREPQGSAVRLFEPAPAPMPGQTGMEL